jgi:hypothetical protein
MHAEYAASCEDSLPHLHQLLLTGVCTQNLVVSAMAIFRQLPIGALFEPRATIPSCSISAIRKQVATGSSIFRGRLLQYSLSGGCCDSMCCSARRHARDNEISRYTGARVLSVMGILQQLQPVS